MSSVKTGFSTTATAIIAILLIIPFLIRSLAPALEPYPAIVLPLGIGLFNIEETEIDINTIQIMGQNERGEWERIQAGNFLEPVPPYYLHKIAENNFGLITQNRKVIKTAFWGEIQVPRKPITDKDVTSTKHWVRDRLGTLGFRDSTFLLRRTLKTVDLKTDSVKSETTLEEVEFELD